MVLVYLFHGLVTMLGRRQDNRKISSFLKIACGESCVCPTQRNNKVIQARFNQCQSGRRPRMRVITVGGGNGRGIRHSNEGIRHGLPGRAKCRVETKCVRAI